MQLQDHKQAGYTLIELMITIAIIGILAAIAIPSYISYSNRARFASVVQAAAALKPAVAACLQNLNTAVGCSGGTHGIPTPTTSPGIASLTVTNGLISASGTGAAGQPSADTYTLEGSISDGIVTWTTGGTCLAKGTCSS